MTVRVTSGVPSGPTPYKVCEICGKPITTYSTNQIEAKFERKWGIHWPCKMAMENMLDRQSGMVTERKMFSGPQARPRASTEAGYNAYPDPTNPSRGPQSPNHRGNGPQNR